MRYYRVPFDAKDEEKLAFNLTVREILIMSVGLGLGLLTAWIASTILSTLLLYCVPFGLPFVGLAAMLAFVKVNKNGCVMTLEKYAYRKIIFSQRPRHYLKIREEI